MVYYRKSCPWRTTRSTTYQIFGQFDRNSISIRFVRGTFLGNKQIDNYKEIVAEMISAFHAIKVNMSLKIHFLHNHLNFFHQIWVNSVMNMANAFTKTLRSLRNASKEKTSDTYLVNTAGLLFVIQNQNHTNDQNSYYNNYNYIIITYNTKI
ncbi:hypothetical protein ALC60_07500 [Trachymyrmex zeteki]|uniref:Uncharacterized protein n=1 Tax=Mycetomoellerius zeteki TaxID=64791 RepID=A0A151X0B4_9HYME|nr:hypothetical protein ALC60_07500 [Trachymyrmex zeteki]